MKKQYVIFSILLIIFVGVVYVLTRFSRSSILSTEGYFVSNNEIRRVLFSEEENMNVEKISLKKVEYEDIFYKNLNNIYIGEDEKTYVDDDYPIFSNAGSALININEKSSLINTKFEKDDCYLNATITDGKLYNYNDTEQASLDDYYFLKLVNGEYVNLKEITIETYTNKFSIPLNSIINFKEKYIKYFYYDKQDGELIYKEINGLDLQNVMMVGNTKYKYGTVLYKLGLISEEFAEEIDPDEDINNGDSGDDYYSEPDIIKKPQTEYEKVYVKPSAMTTDFEAKTYSASTVLTIRDPAGVIIGGINYYFYKGDKLYLRKAYNTGGKVVITSLEPDTTYKVVASFKYYDIEKKKMELTFFEQTIKTQPTDNLDPIEITYENGEIYADKIELKDVKIVSSLDNDALNGLNKIRVRINGDDYFFPASSLSKMKAGQEISFISTASLKSHTQVHFKIQLFDPFGNEIKSKIKDGETITSKKEPSVQIKIADLKINMVVIDALLQNEDEVNIGNFRYAIYDQNMEVVESGSLDQYQSTNSISLSSLDTNTVYTINVYGDYNLEDGKGNFKDELLGTGKFTTMPLSSLGYFRIDNSIVNLKYDSATIRMSIDKSVTSSILLELLTSMEIKIMDEDKNVVFNRQLTSDEIQAILNDEYASIEVDGLFSKTPYTIEYISGVTQGRKEENIRAISTVTKFKTLKKDARVEITNKFVNSSIIDYDARVVDVDGAIEGDTIVLEVRNSTGKLLAKEELTVNGDFKRFTYEKLDADSYYSNKFIVTAYNVGFDNSTYKSDYVLYEERIRTVEGVKGSVTLNSILRQIDSDNLFNIRDFNRLRTEGNISSKSYDFDNNEVRFSAKNGWVNYSYYLPEGHRHLVSISFEAKYASDSASTAPVYINNNFTNGLVQANQLTGLSKDSWTSYNMEFIMLNPYIGFLINETSNVNQKTDVIFKNIQIVSKDLAISAKTNESLSVHKSGLKFTNTSMIAGNEEMPSYRATETKTVGNYGNGFARITDMETNEIYEFPYTGDVQEFTPDRTSTYRIELWGAAGGDGTGTAGQNQSVGSHGGRGAYTKGEIVLNPDRTLYVYVGGAGKYGSGKSSYKGPVGGYNGGGNGGNSGSGSGGGATDVRLVGGAWDNLTSLESRIMVAAGGGGTDDYNGTLYGSNDGSGGPGGALESNGAYINGVLTITYFATQTYGGGFGKGANVTTNTDTGGAGGGYYGGVASNNSAGGGSGGSSYISGHKGCVAKHNIFVGGVTEYTEYSEKDKYVGTLNVNVDDTRNEIPDQDYYLRIYLDDEEIDTLHYDLVNGKAINELKTYEFLKNKKYTVYLSIKIRGRFYNINLVSFNTNTEIRSIKDMDDFFNMHTNGKYIVLNDLDIRNINRNIAYSFFGEIDFQGHKLTWNVLNRPSYIFHTVRSSALIQNLVIDAYLDNTSSKSWWYGMSYVNYGTFDNVFINIKEAISQPNYVMDIITYVNYGTIKNFVINCEAQFSAQAASGILTWSNQGIIMNGYAYGVNIDGNFENVNRSRKDIGVFAGETSTNSIIQNVFSLIMVNKDKTLSTEESVGNIIGYSGTGTLRNAYSVEDPKATNTNNLTSDPNTGTVSAINAHNLYYVSDTTYGGNTRSVKISKLALYDVDFQETLLNADGAFVVEKYVQLGYYPQVKLNECMPNQEWLALPTVEDRDILDVTSAKEISNNGDSAVIELRINNPAHETITEIGIKDINTVSIISQEHDRDVTKVVVQVSDPKNFTSKYYIRKIVSKGSLNFTSTRNYTEFERGVDFSLYYPIRNITDWKNMNNNRSQNYMLKIDLDFGEVDASKYVITSTFTGKIHGNGHTIKNIRLDTTNGMFTTFRGTMQDLYIENYVKTNASSYGGFIYQADSGAIFDNVHMKDVRTSGVSYVGGFIGYANNVIISNCSINGYQNINTANRADIRIGGLIGYGNQVQMQNSFAANVNIDISDSISTYGIGGLIGGLNSGTLEYVYATGKIITNSVYTGGIAGYCGGKIAYAWTAVEISSDMPFAGGIIGRAASTNINNTLVIGSIESSYLGDNVGRTSGDKFSTNQDNYAWDKQPFNGYLSSNITFEKLLSTEQLESEDTYIDILGFGNQFNYENVGSGQLPKLNNYTTNELLPNQDDVYLTVEQFNVLLVEKEQTVTDAALHIEIDNPDNIEIRELKFDYLRVVKTNISTQDGVTVANLTVEPDRYYDNYVLTGIVYDNNGSNDTYPKRVVIENLKFYRRLSTYEDWQSISTDTYENYRLENDIDFSGKTTIKTNVSIGRLEGMDGQMYTIKNMTVNPTTSDFGIIKIITKNLSDVKFENINIITNASGNYVNIIKYNYGDIYNVAFSDITITAPKASYVAAIGQHRGIDIKNVTIENANVKGTSYVASFIGHALNYDTYNIYATGCTVYGSNQYVGGIIANKDYANPSTNFQVNADNMNVSGIYDVGGVFGYGAADNSWIRDSKVTGISTTATNKYYVGGYAGRLSHRYAKYITVTNVEVKATGQNRIGGVAGWSYDLSYAYVDNVRVTQLGTGYQTGGVVGYKDGYSHNYITVNNCKITSSGDQTGGLYGHNAGTANYNYVYNTEVTGTTKVGGYSGNNTTMRAYYSIINAKVRGTNYVGGMFGYLNSIHDKDSSYSGIAYYTILANVDVQGESNVSGYAGYAPMQLSNTFFYYTLMAVKVNMTGTGTNVGILTPFDNVFQEKLPRFVVYEGSTINGTNIKNVRGLNPIESNRYVTAAQMKTQATYTNNPPNLVTSQFDYTPLSSGNYPKLKNGYGTQNNIKLPTAQVQFTITGATKNGIHELPDYKVYASGVDTINIDFETIDEGTLFQLSSGGVTTEEMRVTQRTYTFQYNFKDRIDIVLTDGLNKTVEMIDPSELVNKVTTFEDKYAYIYEDELKGNLSGYANALHVYNNYLLTSDMKIYNLSDNTLMANYKDIEFSMYRDPVPLYEFRYDKSKIRTYGTYSIIENNGEETMYDNAIYVKNNQIEIIDNNINRNIYGIIIDKYQEKEIATILLKHNRILNLKDKILTPEGFKKEDVIYMSNNINTDSSYVVVMYDTGKVVVFDYRSGKEIVSEKMTDNISFLEYAEKNISSYTSMGIVDEDNNEDYKDALDLKENLKKNNIVKDEDGKYMIEEKASDNITKPDSSLDGKSSGAKENYVTYYNAISNNYEVLDVTKLIEDKDQTSETDKINGNPDLINFYMTNSGSSITTSINILYIFGLIVLGIGVFLVLWLVNVKFIIKEKKDEK